MRRIAMPLAFAAVLAGCASEDATTPVVDAATDGASPDAVPEDAAPPTIGDLFPELTHVAVVVNLSDGFMTPHADDRYSIDFVTGKVSFNDEASIDVEPTALQGLDALVRGTPYRTIDACWSCFIDGAPYPPSIVASSSSMTKEFGASDLACAPTDHDVDGDVVMCSDFQAIHVAVLELLGMPTVPAHCHAYQGC